jgi:putative MFS transporter
MSEFAKAEQRGRFALTVQILFSIGLAAAAFAANWVVPFGWQWMFAIGAVPAVLIFPFRFMLYESPRWLATRGRGGAADAIMSKLEAIAKAEGKPLPELRTDVPVVVQRKPHIVELFQGIYLKRTLTLWTLWSCTYFVGYGLQTWLPSLYRTALQLPPADAVRYASITQVIQLAGGLTCAFGIDYFGRKKLIGGGLFMVSLPLMALGFVMGKLDATNVFWLVTIGLPFLSFANLGLGIWTAENYPTHLRALGSGVAAAWLRAASVLGPFVVGWVLPKWGLNAVFGVFGLVALLGAVTCYIFSEETKGKVLEKLSPPVACD